MYVYVGLNRLKIVVKVLFQASATSFLGLQRCTAVSVVRIPASHIHVRGLWGRYE